MTFKEAKKIYEDYRKLRLNKKSKDKFNLHKKLKDVGYIEEDFIIEKLQRNIKKLNPEIKHIGTDSLMQTISNAIVNEINTILLVSPTTNVVYNGDKDFNTKYCDDNNITVFPLGYSGGTIVTTDKDLGIVFILKDQTSISFITNKLNKWFTKYFKKTEQREIENNHNDILLDNYKVMGSAENKKGNMVVSYCQISFNVDMNLIENICTKKMDKIPKGLSDFGEKTREDLILEVKSWLQN